MVEPTCLDWLIELEGIKTFKLPEDRYFVELKRDREKERVKERSGLNVFRVTLESLR